jgi:predicted secreted hydrolase
MRRRLQELLTLGCMLCAVLATASEPAPWLKADPAYVIRFPRDEGSHPSFGAEWWYITGWLKTSDNQPLGFQITFFRFRKAPGHSDFSSSGEQQVLVGHAALSDPRRDEALHDQREFPLTTARAEAREGGMDIHLDDWSLRKEAGVYVVSFPTRDFSLDLRLRPTQPPMLNGERGFSQKGPDPNLASHYYSVPQLHIRGFVTQQGRSLAVTGTAWLDREWFTLPKGHLPPRWDWIGINFTDGGALMASRLRDKDGQPSWAFGSYRDAAGRLTVFAPQEVIFTPKHTWRSPRTSIVYPIEWEVRAGDLKVSIRPLMMDQEFNARETAHTIYWEGAVRAYRADELIGRGYLELTGYGYHQIEHNAH